ncbi:MAG: hypothetical protein AAGA78_07685, partial [Pseudomonadota bacterium]
IGPAFSNGWWLAEPSPRDAIEAVNACDFLFISHNHPDHLHPETLTQIRRDMPVLTAAFPSRSTERYLRDLGFKTILAAGFDERLVWDGHEVALSVLKSGDFRDDSGLMVEIGGFSAVLSVDANYIDFWRFPEGLSLLASSFAGGASGFPLCFDTFDDTAKARIVTRNRNAVLATNGQMLSKAKPKVFAPYAGFFSERAPRDAAIKAGNGKNSVASYARLTAEHGATLVDLTQTQSLTFEGGRFTGAHALSTEQLPQPDPAVYIAATQQTFEAFDPEDLARYFQASGFEGPLDLRVSLTDESFEQTDFALDIRFRTGAVPEVTLDTQNFPLPAGEQVNMLHIKGRRAEVVRVIRLGLPWEDLSIGFQCRIDRVPNVYNSDFWFHFTNVYVNDLVQRESLACDACHRISHALASA